MTDDLSDIESLLGRYRPPPPAARLRSQLVGRVRRRSRWAFAEAMAALLLIGLNLAQIGASVTHLIPPPRTNEARTQHIAAALARLDLPFSADELNATAQRLAAAEHVTPLPLIRGTAIIDTNKELMP